VTSGRRRESSTLRDCRVILPQVIVWAMDVTYSRARGAES
jgi:hypothetical protein